MDTEKQEEFYVTIYLKSGSIFTFRASKFHLKNDTLSWSNSKDEPMSEQLLYVNLNDVEAVTYHMVNEKAKDTDPEKQEENEFHGIRG